MKKIMTNIVLMKNSSRSNIKANNKSIDTFNIYLIALKNIKINKIYNVYKHKMKIILKDVFSYSKDIIFNNIKLSSSDIGKYKASYVLKQREFLIC
jgi:hypothetical protein